MDLMVLPMKGTLVFLSEGNFYFLKVEHWASFSGGSLRGCFVLRPPFKNRLFLASIPQKETLWISQRSDSVDPQTRTILVSQLKHFRHNMAAAVTKAEVWVPFSETVELWFLWTRGLVAEGVGHRLLKNSKNTTDRHLRSMHQAHSAMDCVNTPLQTVLKTKMF